MKRYIVCVFLLCLAGINLVVAQDTARIYVRVRVRQDAILLRWAAETPLAWKQTNRSGFRVERYTVVRNGALLEKPEKTVLNAGKVVRAEPLESWIPLLATNDNAGIIAQALYGEEFELTGGDAQGFARIVNLAQELEQRFTFSLYAADQDFEMACLAGWGFRDLSVRKGERYLYRIYPATPEDSSRIHPGSVYTGLDEFRPLPCPVGLDAVWNDCSVLLSWNYGALSAHYNSYYIEKAGEDGVFRRLPGRPVSNMNNRSDRSPERIVYVDSLADNVRTYSYRVRGITAFGELGPVSDTVSGKGVRMLAYVPIIRRARVDDDGNLDLEWEFATEGEELLREFELRRSDRADGVYRTAERGIRPGVRSLKYADLQPANYFKIAAIPLEGKERVSHPVLVQPLDTVPPAIPQGISGRIDSLGKVTLTWRRNTEPDLLGYILYRANLQNEEPYPLTDAVWQDTCYTDSVEIRNLNPEIFYYVIAVDKRYNQSPFSERLDLRKPDVIPPLSPLIDNYRITSRGIEIHWIPSPDEDVCVHLLYRAEKGQDSLLVGRFAGQTIDSYLDTVFESGKRYVYSIYAEDRSGLRSVRTPALTVNAPEIKMSGQVIERFDAIADKEHLLVKLVWSNNLEDVRMYELYRREGNLPMTLWKTAPGWQTEIVDERIAVGTEYEYMIRAIFGKGGNSQVKKIIIQ